MYTILVIIIIVSSSINMYADILLASGKDYNNPAQTIQSRVVNTPDQHLMRSAAIGLIAIIFWMTPSLLLIWLPTMVGKLAFMAYSMFVVSVAVFHVMVAYSNLCYKRDPAAMGMIKQYMLIYSAMTIILSTVFSGAIIYLAFTAQLVLYPIHVVCLPLFIMIIFQFILGRLLRNIPYFSSIAGTLGMLISMLSIVHFMMLNSAA